MEDGWVRQWVQRGRIGLTRDSFCARFLYLLMQPNKGYLLQRININSEATERETAVQPQSPTTAVTFRRLEANMDERVRNPD